MNLGLTFAVGQHCEKLRVKYVDAIKSRLLGMDAKARMVYAEEILQRLYEIQLNHPIFHSKVFQKLVIPFFFSDVTEAFERYDINLWNILVNCQKKHGTFFCYWLKFLKHHYDTIGLQRCAYSESDILDGLPNASQCELSNVSQEELSNVSDESTDNLSNIEDEFYKLFDSYDKGVVLGLIKKLEEFNIVRERDYVCKYKNYLAKLMIFMKNQGILKYNRLVPVARIFYGYFNLVVRKTSIGENSVTERNIRVIENRGTAIYDIMEVE